MKVKALVKTRLVQRDEYEGTIDILAEEQGVTGIFAFCTKHSFTPQMKLEVLKRNEAFLSFTKEPREGEIMALPPEQKVMFPILLEAIIGGINALAGRLSEWTIEQGLEMGGRFDSETSLVAKTDNPETQKLICSACA